MPDADHEGPEAVTTYKYTVFKRKPEEDSCKMKYNARR